MKKITTILLMLIASISFSQNAPIDFEAGGFGADWTWTVFENEANPPLEIIANPDQSGANTSATVAKFTALQAGNPWAGVESAHGATDLAPFVLDETNSTIKIMVWKTVISDVGIKLVANSGWAQPEIKVSNTVINQWEELTFDFSEMPNPPEAEGQYDQIVVFPDFDLEGRDQDNIVYFDNITFNAAGTEPSDDPTVAAPTPPALNPDDVVSVFSGAFTDVDGTNFNPGWGQSTQVSFVDIEGNETMKYADFNYQGIEFASALNVTQMETLHVDMWTADATSVNIFLISPGPVETAYALPITPNQWVSYDIPLTAFAGVDLSDVIQFKFDGGDGSPTLYLDNLYFYKEGEVTEGPRNPIDFEPEGFGADWTWNVFENETNPPLEIITNPDQTGANTSATVAKFTALQAGNPWAGVESAHGDTDLGTFLLDETNSIIKIMVWKPVISDVGIKLATATGWAQPEIKVANTLVNAWEEITFDFSDVINNPDGELYDQIIIFPDYDLEGREQDNIVYFDNITFNAAGEEGTDASLSDLQVDGTTVAGFSPSVLNYSVVLPEGTTDVPTVTATTNDPEASAVITPADAIPGTTSILVTSANTEVERTYTVAFSIESGTVEGPRNPIDFEPEGFGADWTWTVFENETNPPLEIIANPDQTGANTSATVAKFTALQAGNPWAGVESAHGDTDLGPFVLDETNSTIKIMVWKPVISDVGIKLVAASGWAQPEIKVANTVINQWEELTFDFSGMQNPPEAEGLYDQIVVFPDFDLEGREQDNIVYFDNITFNSAGEEGTDASLSDLQVDGTTVAGFSPSVLDYTVVLPEGTTDVPVVTATTNDPEASAVITPADAIPGTTSILVTSANTEVERTYTVSFTVGTVPTEPEVAAPTPPAREPEDVVSVFSAAYANVADTDFNPDWGQSTAVSVVEIEGNETLKYANFNYQGTQFASALNVTEMETLHLDMWTADATSVNISLISTGPVETAYALPITSNEWVSYEIALTEFDGVDLSDVIQFKFDGGDGSPTIYLDNLYFYKTPTSVSDINSDQLTVYPNPVRSGEMVRLSNQVKQVDVFDIAGKLIQSIANTSSVETYGMNRGVYFMRIQSQNGEIQINKLVVK